MASMLDRRAFVSYSRDDSQFALKLAADLKADGAAVWLDQLDIPAGAHWDRAIQEALSTSPIVLVVLSPSSVESTNVQDEVGFAIEEAKTIIPILYRDCVIPLRWRRLQYLDFRHDFEDGFRRLRHALGLQQRAATPAAPPPGQILDPPPPTTPVTAEMVGTKIVREEPPSGVVFDVLKKRPAILLAGIIVPVLIVWAWLSRPVPQDSGGQDVSTDTRAVPSSESSAKSATPGRTAAQQPPPADTPLGSSSLGGSTRPDDIATDPRTRLTWTKRDNGSAVSWDAAKAYCDDLSLAGHTDWRLPSVDELISVYDRNTVTGRATYSDGGVTDTSAMLGITLTQPDVWSGLRADEDAVGYQNFRSVGGGMEGVRVIRPNIPKHKHVVLCVRGPG